MARVKIRSRYQITIPKHIMEKLQLEIGDSVEITIQDDNLLITPAGFEEKIPAAKLSPMEQQSLRSALIKIEALRKDLKSARGLTRDEIAAAVKVGLIDSEQQWWWSEEWQRGERETQQDIEAGQVQEFDSAETFLNSLRA